MASSAVTFSRSLHGQQIEMGMTVEIEVGKVRNRVGRAVR